MGDDSHVVSAGRDAHCVRDARRETAGEHVHVVGSGRDAHGIGAGYVRRRDAHKVGIWRDSRRIDTVNAAHIGHAAAQACSWRSCSHGWSQESRGAA